MNTDEQKRKYAKQVAGVIVKEIFDLVVKESRDHGVEVGEMVLYTTLGSIISTELLNVMKSSDDETLVVENYVAVKRNIEVIVQQAFQKVFELLNPGTTPEFQCDIMAIDDGSQPTGKSH